MTYCNWFSILSFSAENKWKDQANIDSKISSKWKFYVSLYEKAKSEYKPCTDFNTPDSQQLIPNKVSCYYADVIQNDLSPFKDGIM